MLRVFCFLGVLSPMAAARRQQLYCRLLFRNDFRGEWYAAENRADG